MLLFLLSAVFIAGGRGAELGEMDTCDANELKVCIKLIPRTPVGLPRTRDELDAHCKAYQTGMVCMDAWIKRCLPGDGLKLVQQQIRGARALMRYLCSNETSLRKDFLKEPICWSRVSPAWSQCVDELQLAVRDITERSQLLTYVNSNSALCCARDEYMQCVSYAGRVCSTTAAVLLRRMAWVLAQDVAVCSQQQHCSAPPAPPPAAAPLLALLSTLLAYPPHFL